MWCHEGSVSSTQPSISSSQKMWPGEWTQGIARISRKPATMPSKSHPFSLGARSRVVNLSRISASLVRRVTAVLEAIEPEEEGAAELEVMATAIHPALFVKKSIEEQDSCRAADAQIAP